MEKSVKQKRNYGAIDNFRLVAALLIVAIHTAPLESLNSTADFLVTYCMGRVAVPFFLMVTGFFVLAPYQRFVGHSSYQSENAILKTKKFLKKTIALYAIATLLYIPIKIYAKQLSNEVGVWLKEIFFDGTFYHLWYLPAVIIGCLLLMGLIKILSPLTISAITLVLYIIGTAGDSYYQLISQVPVLKTVYDGIFIVSSYTRNGIFFAPIFLWMGVVIANGKIRIPMRIAAEGLAISMAGMIAEGLLTYEMEWQKHNSMYILLLPVMFFLFELLLSVKGTTFKVVRDMSMCVYIIHPACIVLVRGVANVTKVQKILVEQSLVHYLAVCVVSLILSFGIAEIMQFFKNRRATI